MAFKNMYLIGLILLFCFVFWSFEQNTANPLSLDSTPAIPRPSLNALLFEPVLMDQILVENKIPGSNKPSLQLSDLCQHQIKSFLELGLNEIAEAFENTNLDAFPGPACVQEQQALSKHFGDIHKAMAECLVLDKEQMTKTDDENQQPEFESKILECTMQSVFYRALLTEMLTKDAENLHSFDSVVLVYKMHGMLQSGELFEQLPKLTEVATILAEKEPDLYPAVKASIIFKILSLDKDKIETEKWSQLMEDVNQLDSFLVDDPERLELKSYIKKHEFQEEVDKGLSFFETQFEENPESSAARYYLAWSLWSNHKKPEALGHLEALAKKMPDDKRYIETLNEIKNADPKDGKPYFSINITVKFTDIE
jgi:tetratricopeptide (TPR) repeat protein